MFLANILFVYIIFFIIFLSPTGLVLKVCRTWTDGEKLIAVGASSLLLLYFSAFAIYWLDLKWGGLSLAFAFGALFLYYLRALPGFLKSREVTQTVVILAIVNVWLLLLTSLIYSYSAANWVFDWFNHYLKTNFFYFGHPASVLPDLPDRPPLMNLVACFFMHIFGNGYWVFQVLFVIMNSLCILPMLELGRQYSENRCLRTVPLLFFLLLNPLFVQNGTYAWTKLLAVFFILSALHFYLRGWLDKRSDKLVFSWVLMAAGMLTHYSAGPYAVLMGLHYVGYVLWQRQHKWREFVLSFTSSLALFMTWIGWSLYRYGTRGTFLNNPSVTDARAFGGVTGNIVKTLKNVYYTIVPHFISGTTNEDIQQVSFIGYIRDYDFLMYQSNLYFAFGLLGLPVILWLMYRRNREIFAEAKWRQEQFFWWYMVVLSFFFGIAVHGDLAEYGLMHICSQPLVMLGIVYLAAHFRLLDSLLLRMLIAVAVMLDTVFGIVVHFYVQHFQQGLGSLAERVGHNFSLKAGNKLVFLGDYGLHYTPVIWIAAGILFLIITYRFVGDEVLSPDREP